MHVSNVCMWRHAGTDVALGFPSVRTRTKAISMGPVTTAIVLFGAEKLLKRITAGQIHRKGVLRKARRLMGMVLEFHTICSILEDTFGDFSEMFF